LPLEIKADGKLHISVKALVKALNVMMPNVARQVGVNRYAAVIK